VIYKALQKNIDQATRTPLKT